MSDGPRIINPFSDQHIPKSDEIAYNVSRWGIVAKKECPRRLGFIFMFFPRDAIGQAKGAIVANVNNEAVKDELRAAVKRWADGRKIILPGEE